MDSSTIILEMSQDDKNLLTKASNIKNTNIDDFILEASIKAAYEVLSKNGIPLSKEAQLKLTEILHDDSTPTQAMIDLQNLGHFKTSK